MKPICHKVQETLAGEGAPALRNDEAARRHLEECPECFSVMESLTALDRSLESLPPLDAPDAAVKRLLARVGEEEPGRGRESVGGRRWLRGLAAAAGASQVRPAFWGLAAAAGVAAFVGLTVPSLYRARPAAPLAPDRMQTAPGARRGVAAAPASGLEGFEAGQARPSEDESSSDGSFRGDPYRHGNERLSEESEEALRALGYLETDKLERREERPPDPAGEPGPEARLREYEASGKTAEVKAGDVEGGADAAVAEGVGGRVAGKRGGAREDAEELVEAQILQKQALDLRKEQQAAADAAADTSPEATARGSLYGRALRVGGKVAAPKKVVDVAPVYPDVARQARVQGAVILEVTLNRDGRVADAKVVRGVPLLDEAALAAVKQWRYQPTLLNGVPVPVTMTVTVRFGLSATPEDDRSSLPADGATASARAFLAERSSTEGLASQAPRGYWANTYLPGDPTLRVLQTRLAAWDRSALEAAAGLPLRLHDDALQTSQPFDPPRRGALALYLHADRRGIEGPSRMLVQVGLQGSARAGARRPAMNVGLVLDLRGNQPLEVAAGMRALAFALSQAREAGDRFQLIVAGRPGGVAVEPSEFKHGPLMVTLGRLLEGDGVPERESLDLVGAVATAFEAVSRGDNPDAPLGSSTVVLVTGQPLGSSTPALADLAHQGAVAGIPLSVVGVGPDTPLREMDRIALAGQGSRRRLESRSEALALVEQELASAARVVARAVRLRIRLAPGVRLVEVVGSRRLAELQVRRVREAERSIDLRLSRNLGIEADRGEDEDGIQIVIPSFHAGDSHAILLDVVAAGPGPLAEVTARYKDIVELRNGVARASVGVAAGLQADGPLERNVLKNLLAHRLSETLARAGDCLRADDSVRAATLLEAARDLRSGLGALRPAFAADPELGRDMAMLSEYVRLLRGFAATRPDDRARLADSLIYAGWLKVVPRPAPAAAPGA